MYRQCCVAGLGEVNRYGILYMGSENALCRRLSTKTYAIWRKSVPGSRNNKCEGPEGT